MDFFVKTLQGLLTTFQNERHKREALEREAIGAIFTAFIATKEYCELSTCVEDRNKVYKLAKLWAEASAKSRMVFPEWEFDAGQKAILMCNEIQWNEDCAKEKGVDLNDLEEQINELRKR
ncbi:MAG: hypothetical protein ACI9DK_003272 [Vicingaceae bacterium]|jgi:hypothetical protein